MCNLNYHFFLSLAHHHIGSAQFVLSIPKKWNLTLQSCVRPSVYCGKLGLSGMNWTILRQHDKVSEIKLQQIKIFKSRPKGLGLTKIILATLTCYSSHQSSLLGMFSNVRNFGAHVFYNFNSMFYSAATVIISICYIYIRSSLQPNISPQLKEALFYLKQFLLLKLLAVIILHQSISQP